MTPEAVVLGEAEALLFAGRVADAEALCTTAFGAGAAPYIARLRFLLARAQDPATGAECIALDAAITQMNAELARNPLYSASEYWVDHGGRHRALLLNYGMANFKRTVSHNYQNWLIVTQSDPQLQAMLAQWPRYGSAEPWSNEIETPSHVGYHYGDSEYPLVDPARREIYKLAIGLIWEYVLVNDKSGLLQGLEESEIGNPIRITRQGRLISSDLAHSLRERNLLLDTCGLRGDEGLTIGELGAGHGRLAEIFGRTTNYRYVIFDIAPALYVAQWYTQRLFPNERIFTFRPFASFAEIAEELAGCRFAFFTANQIEAFPDEAFDFFINMNSLMEMRREQIINFIRHIDRLTRRAFLSRQWLKWYNDTDKITVGAGDFELGAAWTKTLDAIDEIHPQMFNHIWQRRS
ncbi:MAG: putative sugar O-methyltransferase [Pseudomonadota bacterium]